MNGLRTKVTMQDIAERLNISKNSVSLALNNKKGVSDHLRRQIRETARQMNYGGYAAMEDKSRCILSVVPEYLHNDPYFYSDIFWSIEREATKEGHISIMSSLSRKAEANLTLPPLPPEMDIAGILVIGVVSDAYVIRLKELGYPVISVDIAHPDTSVRCIASANLTGGFSATQYLIARGHRRIGFIGPIYSAQSIYERWCGFQQAMDLHGLNITPGYHITGSRNEFKLFDTTEALEPLVNALDGRPTAWFCAGDRIALALMNILARAGVNVPGDVSVVGFDDIPLSQLIFPPLTTMRVDRKLMGRLAVKNLLYGDDKTIMHISLGVTLIERDSVKHLN